MYNRTEGQRGADGVTWREAARRYLHVETHMQQRSELPGWFHKAERLIIQIGEEKRERTVRVRPGCIWSKHVWQWSDIAILEAHQLARLDRMPQVTQCAHPLTLQHRNGRLLSSVGVCTAGIREWSCGTEVPPDSTLSDYCRIYIYFFKVCSLYFAKNL